MQKINFPKKLTYRISTLTMVFMYIVSSVLDLAQLFLKVYLMILPISLPVTIYATIDTGNWFYNLMIKIGTFLGFSFGTPVLPFIGIAIAYPANFLIALFALLLFPLWFAIHRVNIVNVILKNPWDFFINISEFLPFLSVIPAITMNVHKVISVSRKEDKKKFKKDMEKTKKDIQKKNRALQQAQTKAERDTRHNDENYLEI